MTQRYYWDFNSVSTLLSKWLPESPVTTASRYLRSALLDVRRQKNLDTTHVEDVIIDDYPPRTLSWMPESVLLPPCEASSVTSLFSGARFSVVTGGTGSGKTSHVAFLSALFNHLASSSQLPRDPLLVLNVQSLDPNLWERAEKRDEKLDTQGAFLVKLALALDRIMIRSFGTEQLLASFVALFNPPFSSGERRNSTLHSDSITQLGELFSKHLRGKNLPDKWSVLVQEMLPVTNQLTAEGVWRALLPHDYLTLRLFVLYETATYLHSLDGLPTALLIDNVDNFPEHVQRSLLNSVKVVTAERFFCQHVEVEPPLGVTLLVRLSTKERNAAAFGSHVRYEAFRSPEPCDIIFLRLTECLANAKSDTDFNNLTEHDRQILLERSWYFWRCLAVSSPVKTVLSARAGTNIRNAILYTNRWLLSRRIESCPAVAADYHLRLRSLLVAALCLTRFEAAARAALRQDRFELQGKNRIQAATGVLCAFLESLDMAGRFCKGITPETLTFAEEVDFRHRLWKIHDEEFLELMERAELKGIRSVLRRIVLEAINFFLGEPLNREEVARVLTLAFERYETDGLSKVPYKKLLVKVLASHKSMRFKDAVTKPLTGSYFMPVLATLQKLIGAGRPGPRGSFKLRERLPSRWLATSVLIAPDSPSVRNATSTLNLFSVSGASILEVPLVIIAILAELIGQASTVILKRELRIRGFEDEAQILTALQSLVALDQRLIYCGVRDDYDGVARWWKREKASKISLSAAGLRHVEILTAIPAYMQWSLLEIRDVRESLRLSNDWEGRSMPLERIEKTRLAFTLALESECRRTAACGLEKFTPGLQDGLRRSLMPIAGCFFNCLPGFVEDIRATREGGAKDAALRWLEMGQKAGEFYRTFFRTPLPQTWEENLLFAGRYGEKIDY